MKREEVVEKIGAVLVEEFEVELEDITEDADIFKVLGIDSLDVIDLVVDIEKSFQIKLKTEEMAGVNTIGKLYDHILEKVNKSEAAN